MKFVKYRIKVIAKTKMDKIEVKMKEVMAAKRNILDTEKNKIADTSVRLPMFRYIMYYIKYFSYIYKI